MGSLLEDYKKSQQSGLLDEFKQSKQPEAPVANPAPQVQRIPVANAGPYTSGDEFQALLQQAKQVGVDNLPEPQKSQVKAAIQGGVVREQDLMGAQIPPAVQDTATALGELAKDFVRSGDPKDVQEYAPTFLEGLDQMLSKSAQMPGAESAGQSLQRFTEAFQLMPDTIPRDNSLEEVGRATKNLVKGAIRLAPELLTGLQQNPYEFVKGFVTFPIHQINVLLQASIGWRLEPGQPVEATAEEVRKAREDVVNNPLGVLMLGMMAVGGAKGLKQSEYATVNLKEYQRIAEQAKAGGDGLSAMEIVEAADKIVKDWADPGAPQLTYQPNLGVMKERAKGKVSDRPMTPAEWKEWLANEDANAPVVTHKKGKAPKVEEKTSVTMGAEDVGKPVPEAKPVETPEVVNTKAWTDPVDIAAKEAGDAHGIVYNGQFPATKKKPASYTFYDPQANNTNINVFDLNDLPDRVAEVREKFKKAEADKAAEEAAKPTPPVASVQGGRQYIHMTTDAGYDGIMKSGELKIGQQRTYGDPELGNAIYLTNEGSFYTDPVKAAESRLPEYTKKVNVTVSNDANIVTINTLDDLNGLARELGYENSDKMLRELGIAGGVKSSEKASAAVVKRLRDKGIDGIEVPNHIKDGNGVTVLTGEQTAIYNPKVVKVEKPTPPVASVQGGGIWESVQANNDLSGTVGIHKPALDAMVKAYADPKSVIWERPIAIKENGEIIEGFHRATAAKIAGVEPPMTVLTAKEVSGLNATEVDQLAKRKYTKQSTPPSPVGEPPVASVQGGNPRSEFINGKDPGLVTQAEYIQANSGAYLRAAKERGQSTISNRAKGSLIGAHRNFVNRLLSEGKPVPPEVLKDYPDLVKKGELVKPEPVNTGFKEADIARNLAHTRVFIKSLEERIKEGDKNPETVKTWKRQLQEAKAEEADLMKQVEDVKADNLLGAGLSPDQITAGITNRALREAERRRAASRSEADVSEPAQIEGTIQQPSIRVLHDTKDIGISAGIRTPQGLLGAAPDLPARYGEAAKEAGQTILLTETEIMRESGFRAERLQDALKKADKKDWGKNGDKLYDHIADPSRDGELQPSSLEAVQEVRKFLEEDRQEIIGIKREKLRKSVSTLEEKAYRQANDLVGKKLDEAQIAEVQALAEEALKEKIPDDWGVVNYLPQFHPGSWEILRDGVHVGTAHTPFDAKLKAIEDYASHPELTPDSYTIQGRAFRGGDVVRVGRPRFRKIVSDIADAAEGAVSKDEVSQFLAGKIGTKEGKQKFAGFLQKREGFEGFSKDLPRVLGMYNQQFVRWKYLSEMNAKIQPLIDKIKKEERPQTAEYVQGMMDYLWGPPPTKASLLLDNTIAKIPGVRDHVKPMLLDRSMGFIKRRTRDAFLTYAARYHVLNRFQRAQTTEPLIDLKESIEGRRFYASAEGKAKLKEFGIKFLTGGKTIEGIQPRLGTLPADVSWATTREKMRSLAPETSNQEIVWATFFKKGKMRGMSDVEASNYAILQGNVYSQFLALRSDTPLIMRGPVGSSVFQFKRFPIKDIELGIDQVQAKNMPGVAKWLGAKLLLGGAKALVDPKLVGGGYLAYETYQKLKDEYGETVANGVMYGLPGLAGVDMSYSFQLAAQPNGDNFKEALGNAILPPWASTLEAAGAAYANDKGLEDNPLQRGVNSLVEKVPSLKFINAMRAWAVSLDKGEYEFRTSDGRLKFQADLKDVLLKAGGFRTVEEGVSQLAVDGFTEIAAERNEILDRTTMKLLQVLNGEGELNEELFSETMDWNENRPEVPIAADALMTRLRRRVPADKIPEIERKLKALGKNYYYWWKATEGN